MTRFAVTGSALFAGALVLVASASAPEAPDVLVLRGGLLWNGIAEESAPNVALVVRGGRITSIGAEPPTELLSTARVVELADDETLVPGLIDLHAHYAVDLFGKGRVDETEVYPAIFLGNGVTTTYSAGEVNPGEMRALRLAIESGERVGPRLLNSGPYFGRWRRGWKPDTTPDDVRAEVDELAAGGVHCFKAKGLGPELLAALIERAHHHGLTVTGHLDSGFRDTVNPSDAIAMGIDRVEHFQGGAALAPDRSAYSSMVALDPGAPEVRAAAALFVESGTHFDATLSAYGYFARRDPEVFTYFEDERAYFTPWFREWFDAQPPRKPVDAFETIYWLKRKTLMVLVEAGGAHLITTGTDHPSWGEFLPGFGVHRELHALSLAGLSPAQALRCATRNAAAALGLADELGTLEVGKVADLVVVGGDPLADVTATRGPRLVVRAGVAHDARALLENAKGRIGPAGPDEVAEWKPRRR